jgi:transcriptional regulator with XRE-family HTH domain
MDDKLIARVKEVRTAHKLSQPKFAERLGVTRDVIANIETGRVEPKEPLLMLMCRIYDINYDWLMYGEGNRDADSDDSIVMTIKEKYDIDDLDEKVIREYLELTPEQRKVFKEYCKKVFG